MLKIDFLFRYSINLIGTEMGIIHGGALNDDKDLSSGLLSCNLPKTIHIVEG